MGQNLDALEKDLRDLKGIQPCHQMMPFCLSV